MALSTTKLLPEHEKELQRLIQLVNPNDLSVLAATEGGFLTGGFRVDNLLMLRKRLLQVVVGAAPVSDNVRRLLARCSRSHTLLRWLALEALVEARHALAQLLGEPTLIVALLLDARAEVREKGEEWLKSDTPFLRLSQVEASERLQALFSDLCELSGGVSVGAAVAPTREVWLAQKERLELKLRETHSEVRRLKGVDDRLAGALKRLERAGESSTKLADDKKRLEGELRLERQRVLELETELKREVKDRERRLRASLNLALANEFHGWLAQARAVESEVQRQSDDPLLAEVESVLQRQNAVDRHSGNRAMVRRRYELLKQKLVEVRSTLENAIRVTPELPLVEQRVAAEVARLERLLEPEPAVSQLTAELATHLHTTAENSLPALRTLLEQLATYKVLNEHEQVYLRKSLQKRLEAIKALGVELPPEAATRPCHPVARLLGQALAGRSSMIVLIDGHNVLFGLPTRYNPQRATAMSEAEKRERLVADVVRLAQDNPSMRVQIVFDGARQSEAQVAPGVTVLYSGGEGEHRADGVLLNLARFYRHEDAQIPIILVSNDRDLCASAQRIGAVDLPVLEFGAFFAAHDSTL